LELRNRCFNLTAEISMAKNDQSPVTPERLMQLGFAYAPPLIIGAAVSNKVFDSLADGPKSIAEVGRETGASARGYAPS
jgi:hypothetical protein